MSKYKLCDSCTLFLPNNKNAIYRKGILEFCSKRCKYKYLEEERKDALVEKTEGDGK